MACACACDNVTEKKRDEASDGRLWPYVEEKGKQFKKKGRKGLAVLAPSEGAPRTQKKEAKAAMFAGVPSKQDRRTTGQFFVFVE